MAASSAAMWEMDQSIFLGTTQIKITPFLLHAHKQLINVLDAHIVYYNVYTVHIYTPQPQ